MSNKYLLLFFLLLPLTSADITLFTADINLGEFCVNKTTEIQIFPKNLLNNLSLIDQVNISANLSNQVGELIYENNSFFKPITFNEAGNTIIYINISQQEKVLTFSKEIEVKKCNEFDIKEKSDKISNLVKKNILTIVFGILLIAILIIITLALKLSK